MPCSYCNAQFTLIKWKSSCTACQNTFCSDCYSSKLCRTCRLIKNTGYAYQPLMKIKAKELKNYLEYRHVNVALYNEKQELVAALLAFENNKMGNSKSKYPQQPPFQRHRSSSNQANAANTNTFGSYPHQATFRADARTNLPSGVYPHAHSNINVSSSFNCSQANPNQTAFTQMPHPTSAPIFNPSDDVPPSYARTQDDFPTASEFVAEETDISWPSSDSSTSSSQPEVVSDRTHRPYPAPNEATQRKDTKPSHPVGTGLNGKLVIKDITSVEQILILSNKELKQILVDNFIDYKGCVEKVELQNKVRALYIDRNKNEADMKASEEQATDNSNNEVDEKSCKICWDATIDCVFLECGHMAACTNCGKRLNECPICRQFIVRCVHVFRT